MARIPEELLLKVDVDDALCALHRYEIAERRRFWIALATGLAGGLVFTVVMLLALWVFA